MPQILLNLGFDNFQMRLDYSVSDYSDPDYQGYAPPGIKTSEAAWIIYKYSFDSSQRVTLRQVAVKSIWDNRTTSVVYS